MKNFNKELVKFNISVLVVDVDIFRSQSFPYFALNYRGVTFLNEVVNQNLCLIGELHQPPCDSNSNFGISHVQAFKFTGRGILKS